MGDIAVAQFAPGEDKSANLAALQDLAEEAAGRGARVVVAPEYAMYTAPAMDRRFVDSAEPLDGPYTTALRELAARLGIHLVAGINEQRDGSTIFNTLVAAGPDGVVTAVYRKLHLYDAFGFTESSIVHPGAVGDFGTFEADGLVFGMQTCYDLRFPEVTRRLVDAGADVVLVPAEWVPGPLKEDHFVTLLRARAIENTVYVAAADQCAPTGAGNSMIVDPMGVVVASLGERTGTAAATATRERISAVRKVNPALELRRFTVTERR
ncbi:hydrolase [Streptomyces abyssalis]|uniref:Hydrolase n=1 Tax=Streptomyces abyssalis TaxID=933944 RepID=A0A1E7JPD2_9ACTN|nr:carbon-nitrogen hydrolase family protein [Streptomyces abyssalis]OEU86507.1 hydrolase [Streptomyces abyssalis]OEU90103.1 hydrolase [Streptomyces abyssalis]OEV29070.1 hydrolase [Streptomyces nanshensis]